MEEKSLILKYLIENKKRLLSAYHLKKIGLIGSASRNEMKSTSDIDLIIELEETAPDIYLIKKSIRKDLESQFHRPVDVVNSKFLKDYIRADVLRDAIYV